MSDKKNVCIIQLTRVGDILQTYQSLLNVPNENINFILIARKRFAKPIEKILLNVFEKIHYFDTEEVFTGFDLKVTTERVEKFIQEINSDELSLLVNLSFTNSSGYLASLIQSPIKFGLSFDPKNTPQIGDKWSQYIYSNVLTGDYNPFSLVDLFAMMIGNNEVKTSLTPPVEKENFIAIHPFASTKKKRWKSLRWAELLHYFFENNKTDQVYLLGAPNETGDAEEIINTPLIFKYRNRIKNVCGKTTIEEVSDILAKAKLFIGHDSMIGHLAALNNLKTLTISLGSVRPNETSPYGSGNLTFVPQTNCFPCTVEQACENFECHADISHKIVGKFAIEILANPEVEYHNVIESLPKNLFYTSSKVFESYFTEQNLLRLREITNSTQKIKSVLKDVARITWLYFHEEKEEKTSLPFVDAQTKQELKNYLNGVSHLYELSEFGKKYSKYILEELTHENPSTEKLRKLSEQLDEIDHLQNSLRRPYPELTAILNYFAVMRANTRGETLVEITTNTFFLYNDASLICSIFYELLEKIIKQNDRVENKPAERN